jgi:two-component system, chemotaxis family, response regulator Rcp1
MGRDNSPRTPRILLVEDNPGDARLVEEGLRESNIPCELRVAKDGREALRLLKQDVDNTWPDLVLLDLNLPMINGHEVLKEIRSDTKIAALPVIIMSSSNTDEDIRKAYKGHANCYVQKPRDLNGYFRIVSDIQDFWLRTAHLPSRKPTASLV